MRKYLLLIFVVVLGLSLYSSLFPTLPAVDSAGHSTVSDGNKLVVVTYNIRGCRDDNGVADVEAIARELKDLNPDIIALQEVDEGLPRSGFVHQAQVLAKLLHMNYAYSPSLNFVIGTYGNAILSKYPIDSKKSYMLPSSHEQRSLLQAQINFDGKPLMVYATHLGLDKSERALQLSALSDYVKRDKGNRPAILLGDFNTDQKDPMLQPLRQILTDPLYTQHEHFATIAGKPVRQIDHIFISKDFSLNYATTTTASRSDHYPVCFHLDVPPIKA
ncbi:endonuclease/exonuclease/phosphatase family protein [Brevibacillus ginsengisoli]|uniref:endonuclease/exonuclease/phosphatase family protein n=1 Tax=Brevibacillus ginsengisoli TaxID=363854 RepID=UPI003CEC276B